MAKKDYTKKTSQGWQIYRTHVGKDVNSAGKPRTHVVVKHPNGTYAVGMGYDVKTGEWGQGSYGFKTSSEATSWIRKNKGIK